MLIPLLLLACSDNKNHQHDDHNDSFDTAEVTDTADTTDTTDTTDTSNTDDTIYRFERDGETSVSNSGQTFRLALITELASWLDSRQQALGNSWNPSDTSSVLNDIDFYLYFDSSVGGQIPFSFVSNSEELVFDDISSGKNIIEKLAGNDPLTDHQNWTGGNFTGWTTGSPNSPEELLTYWSTLYSEQVINTGGAPTAGPIGDYSNVSITPDGHDLTTLIHTFLIMAVPFSQVTDDYLDDDTDGKGLKADHSEIVDGKNHTQLEHAWDEGFGYFGAARDFLNYTNDEVVTGMSLDSDEDGYIDLKTEYNWSHMIWAASVDKGTQSSTNPTAFASSAIEALIQGRAYIANTPLGTPQDDYLSTLSEFRNTAVDNWDHALAGTVAHYLNEVLDHMNNFDTSDYDFEAHATSWSALKGISLGLQFNPRSTFTDTNFYTFHSLIGDAPVLPNAEAASTTNYISNLEMARTLIATTYGFEDVETW